MVSLQFVQRRTSSPDEIAANPRLVWPFQEKRTGFLFSGTIKINNGFTRTARVDQDGNPYTQITAYAVVRPLVFFQPSDPVRKTAINPGDFGIVPLQSIFRGGRVTVRPPTTRVVLFSSSPTHQWLSGRITITSATTLGALSQFAIFGATQEDPKDFYVESATDLDSGGVTQSYTRMNAVFVPHRNARYLGVGSRVYSLPNTGTWRTHYYKKWMVEKLPVGTTIPSPKYGKAREVVVRVRPDRLNFAPNPGAEVNTTGWITTVTGTVSRDTTFFYNGTASIRYTSLSGGDMSMQYSNTAIPVEPGDVFSAAGWVRPGSTARTVQIYFRWYNAAGTLISDSYIPSFKESAATWSRLKIENVLVPAGAATGTLVFRALSTTTAEFHNVDEVIIERSERVGDYFDGSTSVDTLWESGGTVGSARSYLYKNRAERYAAIKRVLQDNVPLGIGIAEPLFAGGPMPQQVDSNNGTTGPLLYGAGLYGAGSYGG